MVRALVASAIALIALRAAQTPSRWSKIDASSDFRGWRQELQHVVDAEGHSPTNHFCLVVETFTPERGPYDGRPPAPESVAHALWREGDKVLEWAGSDADGHILPVPGRAVLDLRTDIVPTVADLHGSTYRETLGWLTSIRRHCMREGAQVIVLRTG